jgi:hypothetical protein
MTPEQFHECRRQAVALHDEQVAALRMVSLDAIFLALALGEAVKAWQAPAAPAKAARKGSEAPIITEGVRDTLIALQGQRLRLSVILMQCGLLPTTDAKTRQFAKELRDAGYKSTRSAGEVVFDLTFPG